MKEMNGLIELKELKLGDVRWYEGCRDKDGLKVSWDWVRWVRGQLLPKL